MGMWRRLESWLSWFPLYRRQARDADLARELRDHLELEADEQRAAGLSPEEAACAAQRAFGNTLKIKEDVRTAWGFQWLETLRQDVRYALRMLRKSPGFTLVAALTLAVGIGASTTVFSWVRAVLLNPLPGAAEPQRVVALESMGSDGHWYPTSYLDFRDLRRNCKLIESMSVTKPMALPVGNGDTVERVWGEVVSGSFFDLLGINPEIGRFFSSAEVDHEQNAHPLLVISHAYWMSHYNGAPHTIGSTLRIGHL